MRTYPHLSKLVHLNALVETLCSSPGLLEGRLFRRRGSLYTVTRIDDSTGLAHLAADAGHELVVSCEELILVEALADIGLSTPSVSVNGGGFAVTRPHVPAGGKPAVLRSDARALEQTVRVQDGKAPPPRPFQPQQPVVIRLTGRLATVMAVSPEGDRVVIRFDDTTDEMSVKPSAIQPRTTAPVLALVRDDRGQDLVEYVLLVSLIALAVALAFPPVSAAISGVFASVASAVGGGGTGGGQ